MLSMEEEADRSITMNTAVMLAQSPHLKVSRVKDILTKDLSRLEAALDKKYYLRPRKIHDTIEQDEQSLIDLLHTLEQDGTLARVEQQFKQALENRNGN